MLTVTAAQHGREVNGLEVCRRLLGWIAGRPLRGPVQVFPIANPPAVEAVSQTVPGEKQNPNRVWPGRADGTTTERIAAALAPHIARSDYLVDLHGWSDWTVRAALVPSSRHEAALALARAFGLECIYCNRDGFQRGNLKTFAAGEGVVGIGIELTPQWRLSEDSVEAGLRGVINVLKHLDMLPGRPVPPRRQWLYTAETPRADVLARKAGLYVQAVSPGAAVRKGAVLGRLCGLDDLKPIQEVRAPIAGLLVNAGPCRGGVECSIVEAGAMLAQVWQAKRLR